MMIFKMIVSDYHGDDSGNPEDDYHDNMNYETVILSHVT